MLRYYYSVRKDISLGTASINFEEVHNEYFNLENLVLTLYIIKICKITDFFEKNCVVRWFKPVLLARTPQQQ